MSLLGDLGTAIKNKLGRTSVDNTVPRYDGTTCTLQGSGVTISDTNVVTASGGFVGNLTGNAATATTATKLATARTIGGVSFDGSANINLPGVNTAGNQNTTGNAATATNATKLNDAVEATTATANTIVKRDASGYVYVAALNSTLADTTTAATHYYCETGSDGWLRPKTLANVKDEIAGDKAPLASPALTGTPTAPTAAAGTNTTQLATTAFVQANKTAVNSTTVASATAGIGAGAVGSYAYMRFVQYQTVIEVGSTRAGSYLNYTCTGGTYGGDSTTSPSGTWRLMGHGKTESASLWLRIA